MGGSGIVPKGADVIYRWPPALYRTAFAAMPSLCNLQFRIHCRPAPRFLDTISEIIEEWI